MDILEQEKVTGPSDFGCFSFAMGFLCTVTN